MYYKTYPFEVVQWQSVLINVDHDQELLTVVTDLPCMWSHGLP